MTFLWEHIVFLLGTLLVIGLVATATIAENVSKTLSASELSPPAASAASIPDASNGVSSTATSALPASQTASQPTAIHAIRGGEAFDD